MSENKAVIAWERANRPVATVMTETLIGSNIVPVVDELGRALCGEIERLEAENDRLKEVCKSVFSIQRTYFDGHAFALYSDVRRVQDIIKQALAKAEKTEEKENTCFTSPQQNAMALRDCEGNGHYLCKDCATYISKAYEEEEGK